MECKEAWKKTEISLLASEPQMDLRYESHDFSGDGCERATHVIARAYVGGMASDAVCIGTEKGSRHRSGAQRSCWNTLAAGCIRQHAWTWESCCRGPRIPPNAQANSSKWRDGAASAMATRDLRGAERPRSKSRAAPSGVGRRRLAGEAPVGAVGPIEQLDAPRGQLVADLVGAGEVFRGPRLGAFLNASFDVGLVDAELRGAPIAHSSEERGGILTPDAEPRLERVERCFTRLERCA